MKKMAATAIVTLLAVAPLLVQTDVAGERDYKQNANEAAMVLGFVVKYDVVDLVGTQVSVAANVPKTTLTVIAKK